MDSISLLLKKMTGDLDNNINILKEEFKSLDYKDDEQQSILHILTDNQYDEEKCFLAIKSLLKYGLSPNLVDDYDYNFIQTALYTGYSEEFILGIIDVSLKYGLEVNHVDQDIDTIMHTAIYSDNYTGGLKKILYTLFKNGFNITRKDISSYSLVDAVSLMVQSGKYNIKEKTDFVNYYYDLVKLKNNKPVESKEKISNEIEYKNDEIKKDLFPYLDSKDIDTIEEFGKILNKKDYKINPIIGRDKELKNLMVSLAQDKKSPIIVGESGVGKTALVEELAYRIKNNNVPSFLKDKIILEISPSELVAGCKYLGMFEEKIKKLMEVCKKYNLILFIDEIHTIFGTGSTDKNDNDLSSMLKYYIDRLDLKVIGTTTIVEYDKYFKDDALKRRFDRINISEPDDELLIKIINKVIDDYSSKTNIKFKNDSIKNQVVEIISEATMKRHRVHTNMLNNPDLSISIIDKAYAFAKFYDSEFIEIKHFIESFSCCDNIYEVAKESSISKLYNLNINKQKTKILKLNFN